MTGVEVEILEHKLTPEQRRIYDAYAGAFKIIHSNIQEALKATGIVDGEDTLNRNAKAAALSAFEGAKQRFFGHLLTAMKCPSLIRAIEADLASGRSSVIQLVSTGEALMERRIAEIPASEWDDLSVDLTPRETVIEFLAHAFPVQLQEPFTDESGNLFSRPVFDGDGNPGALPGGGRPPRRADREARGAPAGAVGARPDRAAFRARGGRGSDRPVAPGAENFRCARRAPGAAQPAGVRQPRRDRRLHGRRQAHSRLLHGRRDGPQLPRRSFLRQYRAPDPLPAGTGMARRPGDPGPRAHPPHAPGLGAAVPPRHHQCEGRAALHRHHCQAARQPRRHHPRPARFPDRHGRRRPGALPRERQPGEPLRQGGAAGVSTSPSGAATSRAGRSTVSRTPPASSWSTKATSRRTCRRCRVS